MARQSAAAALDDDWEAALAEGAPDQVDGGAAAAAAAGGAPQQADRSARTPSAPRVGGQQKLTAFLAPDDTGLARRVRKRPAAAAKPQTRKQQRFLDLGQSDFGRRETCAKCGMLFEPGEPGDAAVHARFCGSGRFRGGAEVARVAGGAVREVALAADAAQPVLEAMREALSWSGGSAGGDDGGGVLLVFVRGGRAAGAVVVRRLPAGARARAFADGRLGGEPRPVDLEVAQLWVAAGNRRQGVARALVDVARRHMAYASTVAVERLAFSQLTELGAEFARGYVGGSPLVHVPRDS